MIYDHPRPPHLQGAFISISLCWTHPIRPDWSWPKKREDFDLEYTQSVKFFARLNSRRSITTKSGDVNLAFVCYSKRETARR